MLRQRPIWPAKQSVIFIHNWRCAGSTINSVLSSNFHDSYLKIGHPFTIFGWPFDYSNHPEPLLSLGAIRNRIQQAIPHPVIVGGHIFLGLESFLPGRFDIWMNYRDPMSRLNSGILRFYNKQFSKGPDKSHLIDVSQSLATTNLDVPVFVDQLLSSTLKRESNGMCRRLAALAVSNSFSLHPQTNVETLDSLSDDYNDQELFEIAFSNLENVRVFINSSHIYVSLLCVERVYNLNSPLINPFSSLSHNPVTISGAKQNDTSVIDGCKPILEKHSRSDLRLFPYLNKLFADQVNRSQIDDQEVVARQAIHNERLLNPNWFLDEKLRRSDVVDLVSASLEKRCRQFSSVDNLILETFLKWEGLTYDFRADINKNLVDNFMRPVFI